MASTGHHPIGGTNGLKVKECARQNLSGSAADLVYKKRIPQGQMES
jgi:hypothetical protein